MLTPFGDPHNHDKYSTKKGVILHHIFNSVANWYVRTHNSTYDVSCILPRWFFGLNLGPYA